MVAAGLQEFQDHFQAPISVSAYNKDQVRVSGFKFRPCCGIMTALISVVWRLHLKITLNPSSLICFGHPDFDKLCQKEAAESEGERPDHDMRDHNALRDACAFLLLASDTLRDLASQEAVCRLLFNEVRKQPPTPSPGTLRFFAPQNLDRKR